MFEKKAGESLTTLSPPLSDRDHSPLSTRQSGAQRALPFFKATTLRMRHGTTQHEVMHYISVGYLVRRGIFIDYVIIFWTSDGFKSKHIITATEKLIKIPKAEPILIET